MRKPWQKKQRPLNDQEKASAYMVAMLDRVSDWAEDHKIPPGDVLKLMLLVMHTQALAFQQRPELVGHYLDELEGFIIEVKLSKHDAEYVRNLGTDLVTSIWTRIDNMVTDVEVKLDA